MTRWEGCVAAGTSDCPEPVHDVTPALDAWSHVGPDAASLRPWARGYSGHLFEEAGRLDEAITAYGEVIASATVPADLREWAGFQLGELLASRGGDGARAPFELSATSGDGAIASASHFRLLGLALSDGRWEDAALIGLAWNLEDEEAFPFSADAKELTTQALVRLGPKAPSFLVARRDQGAVLRCVGGRLVEVAKRHLDAGHWSWATAIVGAPDVAALSAEEDARRRLDSLRERLRGPPSDDASARGRRVIA